MRLKEGTRSVLYALGFNLLLGVCTFGYFILKEKGIFTLFADFNNQQIPFNILANQAVKSGEVFWNWNVDLGSNFIGAFSFYNLGSPLFWITLLFPAKAFPYLAGWIFILKYAVAGATSCAYIQLFVKDKKYAVLGSALYAFSGFQAANLLFYHFHDVVALFPLMLWGIEKMLVEKKKAVFAFTVFLNALLNYFFFVGEVIFVVIYFLVRFFFKRKTRFKDSIQCLIEGALGTAMSAALLLPSVMFVLSNPRVEEKISGIKALAFNETKYLQILRALFFPGENMSYSSCLYWGEWSSCAAYLPMVGIVLVLAFAVSKPRHWLSKMLMVSAVFSVVPVLGSIFYLFNETVYQRWYYMPLLLMALASALVLENRRQFKVKTGIVVSAAAVILLTVIVAFAGKVTGTELVFRKYVFWALTAIAAAGVALTYLVVVKIKDHVWYRRGIFIGIAVFCIGTTALNCILYRKAAGMSSQQYYAEIKRVENVDTPDEQYRFNNDNNLVTMTVPLAGIGSWCSTVGSGIFEFYESLGLERTIVNIKGPDGTVELLGGKYTIYNEKQESGSLVSTVESDEGNIYIYENEDVLPIGFTQDIYMLKSDFLELDPELRALAMIKALVVEDDMESEVKSVLREYDPAEDGVISSENKVNDIREHLQEKGKNFNRSGKGFSLTMTADSDKYAFFSVPADDGWTAEVNGKSVEILDVNGMMAVQISEGQNEIEFKYEVPFLREGIIISIIGITVWGIYYAVTRRKK